MIQTLTRLTYLGILIIAASIIPLKAVSEEATTENVQTTIIPCIWSNNIKIFNPKNAPLSYYLKEGDQYKELISYNQQLGKAISYSGSNQLSIYKKDKKDFTLINTTTIDKKSKRIVLMIIGEEQLENGSEKWQVIPVDLSHMDLSIDKDYEVNTTVIPFVWLNALKDSHDKAPTFYIKDQKRFKKFRGKNERMGTPTRHKGKPILPIYIKSNNDYELIDEVSILEDSKKLVLFILGSHKNEDGSDVWKIVPVNISAEKLPNGGIFMLNATNMDIQAQVWNKKEYIDAYESHFFYEQSEKDDTGVVITDAESGKKLYSIVTKTSDKRPYIIVFYLENGKRKAYRLRIFRDINLL